MRVLWPLFLLPLHGSPSTLGIFIGPFPGVRGLFPRCHTRSSHDWRVQIGLGQNFWSVDGWGGQEDGRVVQLAGQQGDMVEDALRLEGGLGHQVSRVEVGGLA